MYSRRTFCSVSQWIGKTISGEKLNQLLDGMPLLKFMHNNDKHFSMQYKTGDNKDILPFDDSGRSLSGGIYVTSLRHYNDFYNEYGDYASRVRIKPEALVRVVSDNRFKCSEIYLEDKMPKDDLIKTLFKEVKTQSELASQLIKKNIDIFKYIDDEMKTPELSLEAVKNNGMILQFINDDMKTHEIMMEAVKNNGCAIKFINDDMKTPEMMMEAVKNDAMALEFIGDEFKTRDIMITAVKKDGMALQFIKDRIKTPEIIIHAVRQNGLALQCINDKMKTHEIMTQAVRNNANALEFINDRSYKKRWMGAPIYHR